MVLFPLSLFVCPYLYFFCESLYDTSKCAIPDDAAFITMQRKCTLVQRNFGEKNDEDAEDNVKEQSIEPVVLLEMAVCFHHSSKKKEVIVPSPLMTEKQWRLSAHQASQQ